MSIADEDERVRATLDELNAELTLDAEQIAQYRRNGFIHLKGVFSPEVRQNMPRVIAWCRQLVFFGVCVD